jgi:thymidine kinase
MIEGGAITVFNTNTKNLYSFKVIKSKTNPKNISVKIYVEGLKSTFFRNMAWFNTDKMVLNIADEYAKNDALCIEGMGVFSFILRNLERLSEYKELKYKFKENYGYDYIEPKISELEAIGIEKV